MRGHETVLAMRRAGFTPSAVWIDDLGLQTCLPKCWAEYGSSAQIELHPNDNPRRVDLRFAAGLTVWLSCRDAQRLQHLTEQAQACGAARVLGSLFDASHNVIAMTDTEGRLEWQS